MDPQAIFAAVQCVFCLIVPVVVAKWLATTSAPPPGYTQVRKPSRRRWVLRPMRSTASVCRPTNQGLLDVMPVAYAVTLIFGTVGSAIVLPGLGPAMLGIDLEAAAKRYEEKHAAGGGRRPRHGWHQFELRAFRVNRTWTVVGKRPQEAEAAGSGSARVVQRIRQGGQIKDATADTVIHGGDVLAVAGRRDVL